MRVLHVLEATIGGTRRHLVDVATGQLARGLDVHVVAAVVREPRFAADLAALEQRGAVVHRLDMVRELRPGRDARDLAALERLLVREAPDVVHTHSSKAGVLGRLASAWTGRGARVHTPHTYAFLLTEMFGPVRRGVFRGLETALAGLTDRVVAVSADEGESFRASGVVPAGRVRVVPNGIDPRPWEQAAPLDRAALGVPAEVPLAAVVGLLNVAKGQDLALRALAEPGCGDLHLLVAGHGDRREAWERLAADLGVADRVRWLGWRDDVPRLVATADLVVLPSRWEGMPYALLEAMAAGRPVVAARVDGVRGTVVEGETGFTCPVEDVAGLAGALRSFLALDDAGRARLGAAGRAASARSFTADAMVDGLLEVYREVA